MMKVFLDTNVLLDIANDRELSRQAKIICQLSKDGHFELCASYLTYANMNYIMRDRVKTERLTIIAKLRQDIDILSCDAAQFDKALKNRNVRDFEDLLQYQCALAAGCDVVVTNNTKDYREFCQLPLMTSRDFLLQFFSEQ